MRYYTGQHQHYCGIDLHAAILYVCILDAAGEIRVHRNVKSNGVHLRRLGSFPGLTSGPLAFQCPSRTWPG